MGQRADVGGRAELSPGPADKADGAVATLVILRLLAAHPGVEGLHPGRAAVVVHEDDDRVLAEAGLREEGIQPPHVLVDVRDHAEEPGGPLSLIRLLVLLGHPVRPVRRIGRKVEKERLALLAPLLHPLHREVEEDVRAIALVLLEDPVVTVPRIEDVVLPKVRHRGDAPPREINRLIEAALVGQVGIAVAQVPLSEKRRAVAVLPEDLRHRGKAAPHEGAAGADRRRAVVTRVQAGHELAARRRTHR